MARKSSSPVARRLAPVTPSAGPDEIVKRLRRIEGQVRGIQRMIEQERACREVLDQLAAVQQAVRGVSGLVAQRYARECIAKVQGDASETLTHETAADLVDALLRAPR